ncbi:hypothetical protein HO133_010192 [Letharia lupina]|uniref:Uncharacterized protein n=1 Tax=Letharia lupina TaxID=560253 RepID=A0A8H6CKD4_9LECA|nr:uncharacterized protein HO133_010192 [Letharia lupina]KAF6224997.1 hypothetical protein HO133_010192 [Letharia lupina]
MHVPFLGRCLWQALSISYLLTTYARGVHAYPQTNLTSPNSNTSLALSSPILLPSRFSSLTLTYGELSPDRTYTPEPTFTIRPKTRVARYDPGAKCPPALLHLCLPTLASCLGEKALTPEFRVGFTPADIALAFVAALAQQAVEPFDARLSYFEYADAETPVRIVLRSAPHAPTTLTVRSNVMWALKQLPINLFHDPSIWGLDFKVRLRGEDLYLGSLSNSNRPGGVLGAGGEQGGGNGSSDGSEEKQKRALLITQPSNTTAQNLKNPGSSPTDIQYDLRFQLTGLPLPDIGIFSAILEFLLGLGAGDPYQAVESAKLALDTLPVWIYISYNAQPSSTQRLQVYRVVAILQAIARYCVGQRIYQELIFNLLVDDLLLASGCVVRGVGEREWCRGLEG